MSFVISNGILEKYMEEDGVTEVIIPEGVKTVERRAFSNCENISSIFIPHSVKEIDCCFDSGGCMALTEILVDEANPYFTSRNGILYDKKKTALFRCPSGIKSETFVIPDSVEEIGDDAFRSCIHLKEIIIPDTVNYIGYDAFCGCCSMTAIKLPSNPYSILESAFMACRRLEEIVIPDGIDGILSHAFEGCDALRKITLGKDVYELNYMSFTARNLEEIVVDPGNPYYTSEDGILYDKEKRTLLFCPYGKKGEVVIPDGVTQIGAWGFDGFCGCAGLTSVQIPDSVTRISNDAFSDCTGLTSDPIPDGVVRFCTEQ